MAGKFISFTLIVILLTTACTISKNHQERINLPQETTVETAKKIVATVVNDGFFNKISNKFPELNPKEDGISIVSGFTEGSSGPKDVHILIGIKYTGKHYDAKEIATYGKGLVEEYLKDYFGNKT